MDRAIATAGLDVVASGDVWCVARNSHVMVVVLDGDITDAASETWQAAAQLNIDEVGHSTFGFVCALQARSQTSLANRVRTAGFIRRRSKAMQHIVMCTDVHAGVVIHSVLRVSQISNVHFIDQSQGVRVLSSLRAGIDPYAGS